MRALITAVHDIWCAVTARCRIARRDDPVLEYLRRQEKAAWREVGALRAERHRRTGNFAADVYRGVHRDR